MGLFEFVRACARLMLCMFSISQFHLLIMIDIFFSNIVVVGRRNIPKNGPVIFAGNHVRRIDVSIIIFYFG